MLRQPVKVMCKRTIDFKVTQCLDGFLNLNCRVGHASLLLGYMPKEGQPCQNGMSLQCYPISLFSLVSLVCHIMHSLFSEYSESITCTVILYSSMHEIVPILSSPSPHPTPRDRRLTSFICQTRRSLKDIPGEVNQLHNSRGEKH